MTFSLQKKKLIQQKHYGHQKKKKLMNSVEEVNDARGVNAANFTVCVTQTILLHQCLNCNG